MTINKDIIYMDNIVVSKWDNVYCKLLRKIKREGELCDNRTGIKTRSIEGYNFKLNVGKEFPILQTKKVVIRNALSEMLWIYSLRSNDVRDLVARDNHIWGEWEIDEDGIYRVYYPNMTEENKKVIVKDTNGKVKLDAKGNPMYAYSLKEGKVLKEAKYFGPEWAHTIGTAYGWIINEYRQLDSVLEKLKVNPNDRRMIISLWQDIHLKTAVLPSCVWSTEWKVSKGKLNCYVHQRSADVPLGLPFNVSQYAILLAMVAKVSGLEPGSLNWSIMDAHIYVNQMDGINEQLENYKKMKNIEKIGKTSSEKDIYDLINYNKELAQTALHNGRTKEYQNLKRDLELLKVMCCNEKPVLELANKNDFYDFSTKSNSDKEYLKVNSTGNDDIKLLHYTSAPFIKMPIAQ